MKQANSVGTNICESVYTTNVSLAKLAEGPRATRTPARVHLSQATLPASCLRQKGWAPGPLDHQPVPTAVHTLSESKRQNGTITRGQKTRGSLEDGRKKKFYLQGKEVLKIMLNPFNYSYLGRLLLCSQQCLN